MLPPAMEGKIEDTVDLNLKYPSVSERYWTKYYFIPKDKRKKGGDEEKGLGGDGDGDGVKRCGGLEKGEEGNVDMGVLKRDEGTEKEENGGGEKKGQETEKNGSEAELMEVEYTNTEAKKDDSSPDDESSLSLMSQQEEAGETKQHKRPDSSGHVCVMVHTNKLCLVTLSPKHPALAPGMEITEVSYSVGKFNRLDNQVSGKGKRGAQMMGPQSPVCIITCADGSQHAVLAGVHGKLVEVNERLTANPKLLSERPDAEGYLAVILPPLRNGDAPLKRLLTSEQYWAQER